MTENPNPDTPEAHPTPPPPGEDHANAAASPTVTGGDGAPGGAASGEPSVGSAAAGDAPGAAASGAPADGVAGGTAAGKRAGGGRELLIAAVVCAVGAGLVLLAAGRGWAGATVSMPQPLPARHLELTGTDVAPAVNGLGIAGLAGLAGIIATRGIGRIVVGVLIVLIGAGAAVSAFNAGRGGRLLADLRAHASVADGATAHAHPTLWWTVAVAGGVIMIAAGVYTIVRGRRWPGMSSRYDAPGASAKRRAAAAASAAAGTPSGLWDSLDSGTDPTVDAPPPPSAPSNGPASTR